MKPRSPFPVNSSNAWTRPEPAIASSAIIRFPLVQFAAVVMIVLSLQAADEHSFFGWVFDQLDQLVVATVLICSNLISVKSFTRSGLTFFLTVAYVYLALALALFLLRVVLRGLVDLVGWSNAFGLRNAIARERGDRRISGLVAL
jgi:hypothetical protein